METDNLNKEAVWKQKLSYVSRIRDKAGGEVDAGILETVAILLIYQFPTVMSCEGHLGGLPYPWVRISTPEPDNWNELEGELRDEARFKWAIDNSKYGLKMMALLEEFYNNRETIFEARLIIITTFGNGTIEIHSLGGDVTKYLRLDEGRNEKFELYQKEMRDFTEFLKNKFFQGNI